MRVTYPAARTGIHAKKEGGAVGRAAAVLDQVLKESLGGREPIPAE